MKKILLLSLLVAFFATGCATSNNTNLPDESTENLSRNMQEQTIQTTYLFSRNMYDAVNVLENAKSFGTYEAWNNEVSRVLKTFDDVDKSILNLEDSINNVLNEQELSAGIFIKEAKAYDSKEVLSVFDSAPAGRRLRTLAQYYKTDVKRARSILKIAQGQVTAEAWDESGDVFQETENRAREIKDLSKTLVYAGGVYLTGGTVNLVEAGGLLVSGVDLALEIGEDRAIIAYGGNSKIAKIIQKDRQAIAPLATIIGFTNIGNIAQSPDKWDKWDSVFFTADQIRGVVQDKSFAGIDLTEYSKENGKVKISPLDKTEVKQWLSNQGVSDKPELVDEILPPIAKVQMPIDQNTKETNQEQEEAKEETQVTTSSTGLAGTVWSVNIEKGSQTYSKILYNFYDDTVETKYTSLDGKELPPTQYDTMPYTYSNGQGEMGDPTEGETIHIEVNGDQMTASMSGMSFTLTRIK